MLYFFVMATTLFTPVVATEWADLIERHRFLMGEQAYAKINKQYNEFSAGLAPKISHPNVKKIAIVECHEPLVDVDHGLQDRISSLEGDLLIQAHDKIEDIDPRCVKYAYMRQGVYEALCRMIHELDLLAQYFGYASGVLEIKLFEGLRDLATQKYLFDTQVASILQANPTLTYDQAYEKACYFVSPYIDNVPVHSTGAAIDIALYNAQTKEFCSMGRFNKGGFASPTFSEDSSITLEQKKNRLLFLIAATRAGLTNYVYEFWHYSYNDRYALYWNGPVDGTVFSPYGSC